MHVGEKAERKAFNKVQQLAYMKSLQLFVAGLSFIECPFSSLLIEIWFDEWQELRTHERKRLTPVVNEWWSKWKKKEYSAEQTVSNWALISHTFLSIPPIVNKIKWKIDNNMKNFKRLLTYRFPEEKKGNSLRDRKSNPFFSITKSIVKSRNILQFYHID